MGRLKKERSRINMIMTCRKAKELNPMKQEGSKDCREMLILD